MIYHSNYLLVVAVLITLTVLNQSWHKNVYNPFFLFSIGHIISLLIAMGTVKKDLSSSLTLISLLMFISFFIGCYLSNKITFKNNSTILSTNIYSNKLVKKVLPFLYVVVTLFDIISIYSVISQFGLTNFFVKMGLYFSMMKDSEINVSIFILSFLLFYSAIVFLYALYYKLDNKKRLQIFLVLCYVPFIFIKRSFIIYLLIINIFEFIILSNISKKIKKTFIKHKLKIIILIIVFFFAFLITQNAMGKSSKEKQFNWYNIRIPSMLNDIIVYTGFNYPYLDELWDNNPKYLSFSVSTSRGYAINVMSNYYEEISEYFKLDFLNIETINNNYQPFNTTPIQYYAFLDFGYGLSIAFFLCGFCVEKLYLKLRRNLTLQNILIYVWIIPVLILSFREYDMIMNLYYYYLFFIFIMNRLLVLIKKRG
ncbi:MAG: O-antigen ligase [Thomasclavelia ramosa]|nr:O-antigen polymerase [Thomasclavelia ramosa]MCR1949357.1 oligosaccharide repeat unit polymerase [Thomasclavelia ramosa]MDD8036647.1 O-antigen ligase [Thomasclavelia ramosa]QQY28415.1 oligosaccharide repeat unit polymerase [Thomasclavelia ramosa]